MASLAEIREKLKQQENATTSTQLDNGIYPFWSIAEGETATIRLLPDSNTDNTFFWVERQMIKLPFSGIKNDPASKPVTVTIPCMEMYGETCPILSEVRGWFSDASLETIARKYWKKRSYIFQGFVVQNPLKEDNSPENPIRRFIIGPQIFKIIKQALMDPDMEELPTDYTAGLDFRMKKTSDGSGFADYSTSSWARKERPLSDEEMEALNKYGLFNLSDFLPNKPDESAVKIIKEMFEASVDGEPYDPVKWGQHFRPPGLSASDSNNKAATSAPVAAQPSTPAASSDDAPWEEDQVAFTNPVVAEVEEPKASAPTGGAQDILAMIRSRQAQ